MQIMTTLPLTGFARVVLAALASHPEEMPDIHSLVSGSAWGGLSHGVVLNAEMQSGRGAEGVRRGRIEARRSPGGPGFVPAARRATIRWSDDRLSGCSDGR